MVWLNVFGYNGTYQLSDKGDLRRLSSDRGLHIVKSCVAGNGKRYVTLWKDGKRRNVMLHNLYAETFHVPVKVAMRILYEGYQGDATAAARVKTWLMEKIQDCEQKECSGMNMNDEILYLRSFLAQINHIN